MAEPARLAAHNGVVFTSKASRLPRIANQIESHPSAGFGVDVDGASFSSRGLPGSSLRWRRASISHPEFLLRTSGPTCNIHLTPVEDNWESGMHC